MIFELQLYRIITVAQCAFDGICRHQADVVAVVDARLQKFSNQGPLFMLHAAV